MALVGALVGALAGLVFGLAVWLGFLGLVIAGAGMAYALNQAKSRVVGAIGARPIPGGEQPRLRNLIDGLCASNGLALPALWVIPTSSTNCLTVGRSDKDTTLVVTQGLLDQLSRMELEAVIARHLAQVKSGETSLGTVAVPVAQVAQWVGLGPFVLGRIMPERFDVLADIEAVGLTRYPPALASALETIQRDSHVPGAPRITAHLWLNNPGDDSSSPATRSSIDERIAILQEL